MKLELSRSYVFVNSFEILLRLFLLHTLYDLWKYGHIEVLLYLLVLLGLRSIFLVLKGSLLFQPINLSLLRLYHHFFHVVFFSQILLQFDQHTFLRDEVFVLLRLSLTASDRCKLILLPPILFFLRTFKSQFLTIQE